METFTVLSIGIAAALGVMAGVMLLSLDSGVDILALAADRKRHPAAGRHAWLQAAQEAGHKD
jgi:hypothetical protein